MTLGKLVIKFPESRGRICGSPEGVSPRDFTNPPEFVIQ